MLNCFAYTCAFSVAAASVGAQTVSVDLSKKSLARGRENFALNLLSTDGHRFIAEDVMEVPAAARAQRREVRHHHPRSADFLALATAAKQFQVEQDFEKLLSQALELADRDAHILLSTNCTTLNERALEVMARYCLKIARRAGTFHREPDLPDFPRGTGARTVWLTLR